MRLVWLAAISALAVTMAVFTPHVLRAESMWFLRSPDPPPWAEGRRDGMRWRHCGGTHTGSS